MARTQKSKDGTPTARVLWATAPNDVVWVQARGPEISWAQWVHAPDVEQAISNDQLEGSRDGEDQ